MEDRAIYSRYLACDEEIIANIALDEGKVYHQRCIINSISHDLVDIGFTGDEVPEWTLIGIGTPMELRGRADRGAFGCRAVVVDCNIAGHYLIRLIGSVYFGELREFQRIDVYLPIKYAYASEQGLENVTDNWIQRKHELKSAHKNKSSNNAWMDDSTSDNWDEIVPSLAQVTNEGLRLDITEQYPVGIYLDVEIYLPLDPPKVIAAVTEVTSVDEHSKQEDGSVIHRTNVTFALIDPPDREAITDYVSTVQVQHLGEICKDAQYQALYNRLTAQVEWKDPLRFLKRIIVICLIAIFGLLLFRYFDDYRKGHEKGFIEKVFEDGIRRYQEQIKQR
jgi:hypothetical protein